MDKRFLGLLAVIAVIFVGIIYANGQKADNSGGNAPPTNNVEGAGKKNVTLVEYGDYQCPSCSAYYPTVKEVVAKYSDDITFQFRNFPLTQAHPNAFAASRAAEAAGMQNKYWEMYDLLYQNQQLWTPASDPLKTFEQYAKSIGIDTAKFKTDFASDKVNDSINADIREGNKLGVSGTPSFFLNGKALELKSLAGSDSRPSAESFSKAIDAAIAKAAKTK